jgi:uncharacterized Fe-S cluster-containing protein
MEKSIAELVAKLPGKNCGQCGFKTCTGLAEYARQHPDAVKRCIYLDPKTLQVIQPVAAELKEEDITWKDVLDREYDFILEPFPDDPGPRETILPFNPLNIERLEIKKGDVLIGRPAWVGCPITHVGLVMEEPDPLNGTIIWCVVGQMAARDRGIEIGDYNPVAYEGVVRYTKKELQIGRRYYFLPRYCMLQSRHSGLVNALGKREDGMRVRVEGIWIS